MAIAMKCWGVPVDPNSFAAPELQAYRLQGYVHGHPRFEDGDAVTTSRIIAIQDVGDHLVVSTKNTAYDVYPDDVDPAAEAQHPGYYERLRKVAQEVWGNA